MFNKMEKYNQIKGLLNCQDMKYILACAVSHRNLAKLVNKLKLNSRDIKTTKIPTGDLAGSLAEGAFSDPNIFREVGVTLDLYSAEAAKAVNNDNIDEFRDSILKDKGRRGKADTARLIWALLMDSSPEMVHKGKELIAEFTHKKSHIESHKTDMEDGESIEGKDRQTRTNKRQRYQVYKEKLSKTGKPNREPEVSRLKNEIEALKKKNTKLVQQFQHIRDPEKIKNLERKIGLLEKTNRETKENIKRDYVQKVKFDALKKETDRLYQLCRRSDRAKQKNFTEKGKGQIYENSFLNRLKIGLAKRNPFINHRWLARKGKKSRVGVFVDVQNMFYSAKNLYHGRLDFEKFLELALMDRKLVQATAYIVKTPEIDQSKFINLLKNNRYVVKTLDLKTGMNGYAKGNWDVGMVMDIFKLANKLDVIALASGDGDFVPLVKHLQKRGIRVEVYAFAYNTAIDLKECADRFYPLQEDILIKDQRGIVKQH